MNILTLNKASLTVAGNQILVDVTWQVQAGDRIVLLGRNGAGKSSLLKLLQDELSLDKGVYAKVGGLSLAALSQDLPLTAMQPVYDFLVSGLSEVGKVLARYHHVAQTQNETDLVLLQQELEALGGWELLPQIESMATRLNLDTQALMKDLSGGMKRRVLLAAALIAKPQLLLLDEPTNHLDLNSIEWLETYLKSYPGSLIVVTHDREFLASIANRIVEIDRGKLYNYPGDYEAYLDRREARRLEEQGKNALFDKRLTEEEAWLRQGVKARRTRNEGRVRALKAMRETYKARKVELSKMRSLAVEVKASGQKVLEVNQLNYSLGNKPLVRDLSLLLMRGDKLGIVGPNGCGKTTLLRLFLGELLPDSGSTQSGTNLSIAYFDQLRCQLDDSKTLMANVADGADYVTINGRQKHVASYLRDFLFTPERFNQLVSTLSGGERNRLLLAKLLAKPVNLLIMDEPTNDLDIETLELLESILLEYQGTLIVISHDRAFIDQVVTSVLVWEGEGSFNEYIGGYSAYVEEKRKASKLLRNPVEKRKSEPQKLSFKQQRELEALPKDIEALEKELALLRELMQEKSFYQQDKEIILKVAKEIEEKEARLEASYQRWEFLENYTLRD